MERLEITDVKAVPCVDSRFITQRRVTFKQNGVRRTWDYIHQHDSVAILLLNTTRQAFILVKQFRPAVYMAINSKQCGIDNTTVDTDGAGVEIKAPFERGVTYELCAGIVDKKIPLIEIAQAEIMEETGYKVAIENMRKLFTFNGVGTSGSQGTLFYAEVTDDMKVSEGGGNVDEGEFIDLVYVSKEEVKKIIDNEDIAKPSAFIAAFYWYFTHYPN